MYLIISMKVVPFKDVDADKIKKMVEDQNVNLPFFNLLAHNDRQPLGRIHEVKAECYPKEPL